MVLTEGRISLRVMTEVSEVSTENALTGGAGGSTIPSIKTRRAETTLEIPSGGSMAMAGLIQEQTKQAVNGLPGIDQVPLFGQLFRSQDFVNNQTELMVIVTPYVVRAVAQKELSRPDDGFAPASDAQSTLFAQINRIYGIPGSRRTGWKLSGQFWLHHRLKRQDEDRTMTNRTSVDRNRTLCLLGALVGLSGHAGCVHGYQRREVVTARIPDDYRLRHPIAIQEADRSVVIFVGHARGDLSASQRADVIGLARIWVSEGTGAIVADVPVDTPNARAAASSFREIQALLTASGVPLARHLVASLSSGRPSNARDDQAELSKDRSGGRTVRAVA